MDFQRFRNILGGGVVEEEMGFQQRQQQQQQRPPPQQPQQLHNMMVGAEGAGGGAAAARPMISYNYDEDNDGIWGIGGGNTTSSSASPAVGGSGRGKRRRSSTRSNGGVQPPSSLSGIHPALIACRIWCHPRDEHRQQEILNLPWEEREKVWADLSGNSFISHYVNPLAAQAGGSPPGVEAASSSGSSSDESVGINNNETGNVNATTAMAASKCNGKDNDTNTVPLEDAAFIEVCLERMEYEIDYNIPNKEKKAYLEAYSQDPYYVENRNFRIMFLRSDQYDIKSACKRLVGHFTMKRYLFGTENLTKDITQDDLTLDDVDCLKTGGYQYLNGITDHAGRAIVFTRLAYMKYKSSISFVRAAWYQTMSFVSNNHAVQRLGVVCIPYLLDGFGRTDGSNGSDTSGVGGVDYEFIRLAMNAARVWPIRFVAQYNLYQNQAWDHVLDLVAFILGPLVRIRTRNIRGTYQECIYQLMCLGIPQGSLPVVDDGGKGMNTYKFQKWLNTLRQREQDAKRMQLEQENLDAQDVVDMEE